VAPVIEGVYIPADELPPDPPSQKVGTLYVRLVTPEDDLAKRTTPQALIAFVQAVRAQAESTIGASATSKFELKLEMLCTPSGHTMQVGSLGVMDMSALQTLQAFDAAVAKIPKMPTTGEAKFVIGLTVN
jgi:hypothetical protein